MVVSVLVMVVAVGATLTCAGARHARIGVLHA